MSGADWDRLAAAALEGLDQAHLRRHRRLITPLDATHVRYDGGEYVNFASNNYLGLTHHSRVLAAAVQALEEFGAGSGASPLITGYGPPHLAAEAHIAKWKRSQAAVLFPSGYQANHAAVQTFAALAEKHRRKVRFLLDKLCHASLIDAIRGSGMPFRIFPHNHLRKLQRLLEEADRDALQVVVTESIFSMDGDAADLAGLAEMKSNSDFALLLDEAHATGVYGHAGAGLAMELGVADAVDATIITCSKALGTGGGAVCGSRAFCDALVNLARAYIYSTHLPPSSAAAADAAISVMEEEPWRQQRLRQISQSIRNELTKCDWEVMSGDSPIIPLIFGSETAAIAAAEWLLRCGLMVLPIRPPTVPRGSSRLRVTLSSEHTDAEIERLIRALREFKAM